MNGLWFTQGLVGRATFVLLCAVLIEFVGSTILYERIELHASRTEQAHQLAEQLTTAARVLETEPLRNRAAAARELGSDKVAVAWNGVPPFPAPHGLSSQGPSSQGTSLGAPALQAMTADMLAWEPSLRGRGLRLDARKPPRPIAPTRLLAAAALDDGTWVQVSSNLPANTWVVALSGLSSVAILCAGVLASAVVMLRSLGAPLRRLAHAAETIGQGQAVDVPEQGAGDLRRVARAFNSMQHRITDLLAARTMALAAVSHDLRTPLSRARLRAGLVEDADARVALEEDLDEMTAMLDSLLSYLGGRHEAEAPRLSDVAAICLTVVDAAADAGGAATYEGPDQLFANLRPMALKRALDNLVQNALTYAGRADVSLRTEDDVLVLAVEDDGPGIPEAQFARVCEPFQRLDDARARNTKGLGLGLSIVEQIAAAEGGELRLSNRPQGGLRAELRLPWSR